MHYTPYNEIVVLGFLIVILLCIRGYGLVNYLDKISAQKCLILNTLVRYGSVSTAAKALKLPVSKIHNELKSIERAIGAPIILRSKHKIILTQIGSKLADFSRTVAEGLKYLDDSLVIDEVPDLNIAISHGLAETVLPEILAEFHEEYPKVNINIYSGDEYLDFTQQDIDVVMGPPLNNRSDITKTYMCDFTYGFYASEKYIAKKGKPISFSDFVNHDFIAFKGGSFLPPHIRTSLNIILSATNFRALLELTRAGIGICFLCKEFMKLGFYSDKNLVNIIPDFEGSPLKICFMNRKFTNKSLLVNKLQEITLKSIREKIK
ncbi:LysR family transcriptional regulator [Candidatus Paracaedibacter symbiosus]|uniref:LysR family transcriptional regulator n=1 Tax=Candidatus Paracaedibacter symbiosus TaxID=244582 RepID=UPI0005093EF2|nr:LysR family transcriptional regulator [Candidatus Paracaedibacter symbiosus]